MTVSDLKKLLETMEQDGKGDLDLVLKVDKEYFEPSTNYKKDILVYGYDDFTDYEAIVLDTIYSSTNNNDSIISRTIAAQ